MISKQKCRRLLHSNEYYKTYIGSNIDGDISTVYNLVAIRQKGQSDVFAKRARFLWKYKHLFSVNSVKFDHKIANIESIRSSNIGTYLKTLTITEKNIPTLSQFMNENRALNYEEIREGIGKICETIKVLHRLKFAYGLLSLETVKYDFSLRYPPLFYSDTDPQVYSFDNYLSFSINNDNLKYDIYALGLFLYIIVYDAQIESQLTDLDTENLPSFIQELANKNTDKIPSFTQDLVERIKAFVSHRQNYIQIR